MEKSRNLLMLLLFIVAAVVGCSGDDYSAYFLISEDAHNFGVVAVGNSSELELTLTNAGQAALKVTKLEFTDLGTGTVADEFKITEILDFEDAVIAEPYETIKIKSKQHITIKIKFEPTDDVAKSATLAIEHNVKDIAMPYLVQLMGNTAQLDITPATFDFGIVDEGDYSDQTFTVTNNGTTDLMVEGIDFAGNLDFALVNSDTNFTLAPAATKDITVRFSPLAAGGREVTMTLRSNAIQSPTDVILEGVGKPAMNYDPTIQNAVVDPGFAKADGSVTVTITVEVDDQNGMPDIKKVEADCTVISGGMELMYDDGTNGDVTADDKIYTCEYLIPNTASAGIHGINVTATDYSDATASTLCALSLYKGNLIYVDDTTGDDTTGNGSKQQPYKTIQKGIDSAVDTDIVIIMDGEYIGAGNVNLDFSGGTATTKKIVVKSENGADFVTIDCEGTARGFIFNTSETTDSVIQGLTIKNGFDASNGAGIYIEKASPVIVECVITENTVNRTSSGDVRGGGVFITGAGANPEFYYTEISNNLVHSTYGSTSGYAYGGGVFIDADTKPYFEGCRINGNEATRDYYIARGGGMFFNSSTDTRKLVNCEIKENLVQTTYYSNSYGGGIFISAKCLIEFEGCDISENESHSYSTTYAGGIYADSNTGANVTKLSFKDCKINGNIAGSTINSANAGAIYAASYCEITMEYCEINNNSIFTRSTAYGSAMYLISSAVLDIENTEICYNSTISMTSSAYGTIYHSSNCKITFDKVIMNYNNVTAGATSSAYGGGIYNSSSGTTYKFTNSEFNHNNLTGYYTYGGVFRTSSSSNKFTFDKCEICDNSSSSYQGSYGGGIYIASTNPDVDFSETLINGNSLTSMQGSCYGAGCYFSSSTDPTFDQCEINDNFIKAGSSGTIYGVGIYASGSCDVVIDDSEVCGNTGTGYYVYGGGLSLTSSCSINADGSKFNHNVVMSTANDIYGAGIYMNSYPEGVIEFCEINYNEAYCPNDYIYGTGVAIISAYSSSPYINFEQTDISYNVAEGYYVQGGGVYTERSRAFFRSCLISNNQAKARYYAYGGGFYNYAVSSTSSYPIYLYNCTVTENEAYQAHPTTSAYAYGGGVYNSYGAFYIYNGIVWRNRAHYNNSGGAYGNEIYGSSTITLRYTNIANGSTNGVTNISGSYSTSSVLYTDPKFKDMSTDDYNLDTGSPCLDSGNNADVSTSMTKDFAGKTRIVNTTVDRGCYEKQ